LPTSLESRESPAIFSNDPNFENYLLKAPGITREGIIAEFFFQGGGSNSIGGFYPFVVYRAFDALGQDILKKIYPIIGFIIPTSTLLTILIIVLKLNLFSFENLASPLGRGIVYLLIIMAFLHLGTYVVAFGHALDINKRYQSLARQTLNDLDNKEENTDNLLKKAIIYAKVFNDRGKLFQLVTDSLDLPGGDTQLWELAREVITCPIFAPTPGKWLFSGSFGYRVSGLWNWRGWPWQLEEDAQELADKCLDRADEMKIKKFYSP
jgi:hypothetical protein